MFSLHGKVAVITGAGRGIGRAIALAYAQQGADLVLASRTEAELAQARGEVEAKGRRAVVSVADVMKLDEVRALVDRAVEAYGRIDVWVNNAGGASSLGAGRGYGLLIDVTEEGWDAVMQLNLKSPFFAAQAAARVMERQGGGAIINITSIDGVYPAPKEGSYGAAKAALSSLTATLAIELGPRKIRVNAIAPALVDTKLVGRHLQTEEQRRYRASFYPLGRIGKPEDIAAAAVFLASDEASWISGETLLIAGGTKTTSDLIRWLREAYPVPEPKP